MEHSVTPLHETWANEIVTGRDPVHGVRDVSTSVGLRTRSILAGIVTALLLIVLIAVGSRGFHWFDAALVGYAVGSFFAIAAVTYTYAFWLARPPTGRYWRHSWRLFFPLRLHFAAGKRSAALYAYDTCRTRLATDMQTKPLPETVALVSRMRAVEPPPLLQILMSAYLSPCVRTVTQTLRGRNPCTGTCVPLKAFF